VVAEVSDVEVVVCFVLILLGGIFILWAVEAERLAYFLFRRSRRAVQAFFGRTSHEKLIESALDVQARSGAALHKSCNRYRKLLRDELWRGRYLRDVNVEDYSRIQDLLDEPGNMQLQTPLMAYTPLKFKWLLDNLGVEELLWLHGLGYLCDGEPSSTRGP
jgi:hypothetical protein